MNCRIILNRHDVKCFVVYEVVARSARSEDDNRDWLYLAALLDVYSRAVVGWVMSRARDCKLAKDALSMAIGRHGPPVILYPARSTTYLAGRLPGFAVCHDIQ